MRVFIFDKFVEQKFRSLKKVALSLFKTFVQMSNVSGSNRSYFQSHSIFYSSFQQFAREYDHLKLLNSNSKRALNMPPSCC